MTQTIYVKLLDEGVDVWKPVIAKKEACSEVFFILDTQQMDDSEQWEFPPGSYVRVKESVLEGKKVLVAFEIVH